MTGVTIDLIMDLLCCPVCRNDLRRVGGSVRCSTGHSFDLARHGQLNLLGRPAPPHADTADMVAARARFLGGGSYDLILDAVHESVGATPPRPAVLEVGAGTGFYLAALVERLDGRGVALDISPVAARRAARSSPRIGAVVADVWGPLPLHTGSVDVVLAVFAPRHPAEFARVLRPDGLLVVVTPQPEHLVELRDQLGLLGVEPGKDDRLADGLRGHLDVRTRRDVHYRVALELDALVDLVAMGPNAFHRDAAELRTQVRELTRPQAVTVAVTVSTWSPSVRRPANWVR